MKRGEEAKLTGAKKMARRAMTDSKLDLRRHTWLVGMVAGSFAWAGPAQSGTLREDEVVRLALERHPELLEVEAAVDAQRSALKVASSDLLPVASLGYTLLRNDEETTIPFSVAGSPSAITVQPETNARLTFDLTQPIFRGGALLQGRKGARFNLDAAGEDLSAMRVALELRARETVYDLLLAEGRLDIAKENLDQLRESERVVTRRFEVGAAPRSDLLRIQASVAEGEQALLQAENDLELGRVRLNNVISSPLHDAIEIAEDPELPQFDLTLEVCIDRALGERPELRALALRRDAADATRRAATGALLPSVSAQFHYERDSDPGAFAAGDDSWYVAGVARFDWPIGMGNIGRVQQARAAVRATEHRLDATEKRVLLEVEAAYRALEVAQKGIELSARQFSAAEESFRQTEVRYRNGDAAQVDFLDAQARLTGAKVNQLEKRLNLRRAVSRLRAAMGEGAPC